MRGDSEVYGGLGRSRWAMAGVGRRKGGHINLKNHCRVYRSLQGGDRVNQSFAHK